VAEAARITAPGGRVLVLDLRTHQQDWVRAKLGDRRLGFDESELKAMLAAAGLSDVKVGVGARKAGDPFTVLVASGLKPAPVHRVGTTTADRAKRARRVSP
jgi:ArsR family transcriptional regulator